MLPSIEVTLFRIISLIYREKLVTDIEHQYINLRTILCLDCKSVVKRHLQITVAGSFQVLESQQGATGC